MKEVIEMHLKKVDPTHVEVTRVYSDNTTETKIEAIHTGCWNCSTLIGPCMPCNGHS